MDTLLESNVLAPGWLSCRMYHLASKWLLLLTAISFIFIGAAGIWLGIGSGLKQVSFMHSAVKTFGIVTSQLDHQATKNAFDVVDSKIDVANHSEPQKGDTHLAQISVKLQNGVTEHFQYRFGMFEDAPKVGQHIVVYYDPNYYTDIRIGEFLAMWGQSLYFLLPGIILLFSGVTMYSLLMRNTKPMAQSLLSQGQILSLLQSGRRLAAIALASRECGMDISEASIYVDELQKKYTESNVWERSMRKTMRNLPYKNIKFKNNAA